ASGGFLIGFSGFFAPGAPCGFSDMATSPTSCPNGLVQRYENNQSVRSSGRLDRSRKQRGEPPRMRMRLPTRRGDSARGDYAVCDYGWDKKCMQLNISKYLDCVNAMS